MKNLFKINNLKYISGIFAMLLAGIAQAQAWKPDRHVELIIPSTAGGSLDHAGRTFHKLWDELKLMPVTSAVSNRGGGGHAIAYSRPAIPIS